MHLCGIYYYIIDYTPLDNTYRNQKGELAYKYVNDNLIYQKQIKEMSDYIDNLVDDLPTLKKSTRIEDIKEMIRQSYFGITKGELIQKLKWGGGITWTPYRRALMADSNIYDACDATPTYYWSEDD